MKILIKIFVAACLSQAGCCPRHRAAAGLQVGRSIPGDDPSPMITSVMTRIRVTVVAHARVTPDRDSRVSDQPGWASQPAVAP